MYIKYYVLLILLMISHFSALAEKNIKQGKLIKASTLFSQASKKSKVLTQLKMDENVAIQQRKRAWYQITTQAKQPRSGWINMLNVRFIGKSKRQAELGVAAMLSSVSHNTQATASTGIRGFDEKDLANAKANMQQVALLENSVITTDAAKAFAQRGGLATKKLSDGQVKNEK